jgi:hypothetical protein
LPHQFDGSATSAFQFLSGSDGSHTPTTKQTRQVFLSLGWSQ